MATDLSLCVRVMVSMFYLVTPGSAASFHVIVFLVAIVGPHIT